MVNHEHAIEKMVPVKRKKYNNTPPAELATFVKQN